MSLNEKHFNRTQLTKSAQAILDAAQREKREPTPDEHRRFDAMIADVDRLDDEIRLERLENAQRSLTESLGRRLTFDQPGRQPDGVTARGAYIEAKGDSEEFRAFDSYLRGGNPTEYRALQSDLNVSGGYMVAPQQLAAGILKGVDDFLPMRQVATKFTLATAASLGVAALDADPADAVWTSELATGNEDSSMQFGKRELHPMPIAKRLKVSDKLLRQVPSAAAFVQSRLAYKFGVTQERAFMLGTGANQPLGIFTASSEGIPTSRDVSTGNTSTAITFDGLINALYSLKSQYQASKSLRWLFHRDALKMIRKLRTDEGGAGTGHYLWEPSTQVGQPDRLLGIPVISSEYVPATFTTGLYVGAIGDFTFYYIADALAMSVKRLDELYAETNQVGFIGRMESDGMPVLAEAFARVKLA